MRKLSRFVVYTMILFAVAYFVFFIAVNCSPASFPNVNILYLNLGFFFIVAIAINLSKRLHEYYCGYGWLYDRLMRFLMSGFEKPVDNEIKQDS